MKSIIQDSIQSTKIAAATSGATVGAGAGTWLEWIPSDIGKLATLVGIALSIILGYVHLRKSKREDEKHDLEMKIREKRLKDD